MRSFKKISESLKTRVYRKKMRYGYNRVKSSFKKVYSLQKFKKKCYFVKIIELEGIGGLVSFALIIETATKRLS